MGKELLIVYVKNPVAGKVKTRLRPELSDMQSFKIYVWLLQILSKTLDFIDFDIHISHEGGFPENGLILRNNTITGMEQEGKDLGEKMSNDFQKGFNLGYEKICLIGSDIPELNKSLIEKAYSKLNISEAVIGPSFDGGYYLIGFHKKSFSTSLFYDIKWSTDSVYNQTLKNLKKNSISYANIRKLRDIDTFSDLNYFLSSASFSRFRMSFPCSELVAQV